MNVIYCVSINDRMVKVYQSEKTENDTERRVTAVQIRKAIKTLSTAGLKLYCFMCSHINEDWFNANSGNVCELCKISRRTYSTAYKELIQNGYLIQDGKNLYTFFPDGK